MRHKRTIPAMILILALITTLFGCGRNNGPRPITFTVIGELNQEEFRVAFRKDDPLCEIVTAAMEELAAEGQITRLSTQYLGADYSCMPARDGALLSVSADTVPGRKLRIGVQDGVAPLSSSRADGSFSGLIPDMAELVAEKLGWTFEYMVINSESVAAELGSGNIDCAWMAASFAGSEDSCSLSPGWLRNSHQLVVRSESGIRRKNNLKGKVLGITDATALAALKEDGLFEKITSVFISGTMKSIGQAAFAYCIDLTTVGIPNGLFFPFALGIYTLRTGFGLYSLFRI